VLPVALWVKVVTLTLSLMGLAVSTYLTIEHYGHPGLLLCSSNSVINCAVVTTSPQSVFLGIPVAVLGLIGYGVMTTLNLPWLWNVRWYWLHVGRLLVSIGSMAFVLWLVAAEILYIGKICLWCTAVHLITFILLVILSRVVPTQLGWVTSTTE